MLLSLIAENENFHTEVHTKFRGIRSADSKDEIWG